MLLYPNFIRFVVHELLDIIIRPYMLLVNISVIFPNLNCEGNFSLLPFWHILIWHWSKNRRCYQWILPKLSSSLLALTIEEVLGYSLTVATPFWWLTPFAELMLVVAALVFFQADRFSFMCWKYCLICNLNLLCVPVWLLTILFAMFPKRLVLCLENFCKILASCYVAIDRSGRIFVLKISTKLSAIFFGSFFILFLVSSIVAFCFLKDQFHYKLIAKMIGEYFLIFSCLHFER